MKFILTLLLAVVVFPLLCLNAKGQHTNRPPPYDDMPAHPGGYNIHSDLHNVRAKSRRTRKTPSREDRVLKSGLLAPSVDDRTALRQFLSTSNSGLIQLLPRENTYSDEVRKDINVRGGGAYYSFATLTHEFGYGSDIELQQGNLLVGFSGADYGMMRRLGDVPLEAVTIDDPKSFFIATYDPSRLELEARSEYRRFAKGLTHDGALYRSMLPVELYSSYLLRSVVYDKTDVLVAFRVIRKDSDGSVTIAWKLLKKYPAPKLIRAQLEP